MLVSICIPTYSRLQYLKEAVQSALSQDYPDIEVCISQDPMPTGLNAEIKDWCEEQAASEKKIAYHLNDKTLGLAGNWNKLVEIAKGEFIIIIGDDDLLKQDFIGNMVKLFENTNADVVFSNQEFINEKGEVFIEETNHLNKVYKRSELTYGILKDPIETVFNNSVPMSAALIKRSLLKKHPFDKELNTPEFEMFLKLALANRKFAYCNKALAKYRVHGASATASGLSIDKFLRNIIQLKVPEQYTKMKYDFISSKIIPAINISLKKNDEILARYLLQSGYYPTGKKLIKLIQTVLIHSPEFIVNTFYKLYK